MKIIEAYKVRECVSNSDLLTWLRFASSSYYYQPSEGKPDENAYIESFHSIQNLELFSHYEFLSYNEAKEHIRNYMEWYNYSRKHKNLGRITPRQKWEQAILTSTVKPPEQADGKDMSRSVDAIEKTITHQPPGSSLDLSGPDAYLCLTGDRMEANHF